MHLGFFHGTPDGSQFSAYTELAAAASIRDVELAADPTTDAGGVVVWTSDDTASGDVSFARLSAAPPVACPPPPGPTAPGPSTPTQGGTTTVSAKVPGGSVSLTAPKGCIAAGKPFAVKVGSKGKGKVTQVTFSATKAKKKVDRKAPFKTKLTVKAAPGTKVTVKAKVALKQGGAKTLKSRTTVC
jgi:hypothetical protein